MLKAVAVTLFSGWLAAQTTVPTVEKLASGSYVVYATSPQIWRVNIDPRTMANATISGHFAVADGKPKTIDVLVFNAENYAKWNSENEAERRTARSLAAANRAAEGDISARLTDAGYHFLVISNRFQYEGSKKIAAEIKLQYEKR